MDNQVYSDDIGAISVTGPVVRFDLMVLSPTHATQGDQGAKPELVFQQRVIMPLDAFLRAVSRMQGAVKDMEKRGIITRAKDSPRAPAEQKS